MEQFDWLESRPPERLVSDDVVLQRVHVEFVAAILDAVTDSLAELAPWMPWATSDYDLEATGQFIGESDIAWGLGRGMSYVLLAPGDDVLVMGTVGFHNRLRPGWLEIGYWVRTAWTGRRLAQRATAMLLQAVRDHMPEVEGVEIHHDEANGASSSVPIALGFTRDRVIDAAVDSPGATGRHVVWTLDLADTVSATNGPARFD